VDIKGARTAEKWAEQYLSYDDLGKSLSKEM